MEPEEMTFEGIQKKMITPWSMTIRDMVHSYMYLVSVYGQKTLEHCQASVDCAKTEQGYLSEDMTAAKAKALTRASEQGQKLVVLTGELKVMEEMIRALKKAQSYQSTDEYHNR